MARSTRAPLPLAIGSPASHLSISVANLDLDASIYGAVTASLQRSYDALMHQSVAWRKVSILARIAEHESFGVLDDSPATDR